MLLLSARLCCCVCSRRRRTRVRTARRWRQCCRGTPSPGTTSTSASLSTSSASRLSGVCASDAIRRDAPTITLVRSIALRLSSRSACFTDLTHAHNACDPEYLLLTRHTGNYKLSVCPKVNFEWLLLSRQLRADLQPAERSEADARDRTA